jgi:mono/diheme cytochrome c family protein
LAEWLRRALPTLVVAAFALHTPACDPPGRDANQRPISLEALLGSAHAEPDVGAAAYRRTCVSCHGADGRGNAGKSGADFARADGVLTKADPELIRSIREGTTGKIGVMPPHRGLLRDEEVTAVLAYVRRKFGAGIVPAAAPGGSASSPP